MYCPRCSRDVDPSETIYVSPTLPGDQWICMHCHMAGHRAGTAPSDGTAKPTSASGSPQIPAVPSPTRRPSRDEWRDGWRP